MTSSKKPKPDINQIAAWLAKQQNALIDDLQPLSGGFWSSAYAYQANDAHFVLRLSEMSEGFAADQAAMRFIPAGIPVPEIVAIGETLGLHFAISRRHYGRFLETFPAHQANAIGDSLAKLLQGFRATKPLHGTTEVIWYDPSAKGLSWHSWLRGALVDNADIPANSWRAKMAALPRIEALFEQCVERIETLLPLCPERRDLVHGDLLHQNVLVSEDGGEITAVFSWKCSALGDFLFDVAWCTLWSPWHPAIAESNIWQRILAAPDLTPADLINAAQRHHCYELQIAASHLGWNIWTGDNENLHKLADLIEEKLQNGAAMIR